jgi:predicted transposase/invertase (TIGR01784 family)
MHFLELKKMLGARGQNTTLEMWLQFMNNPYSEEVAKYAKEIPAIAEAQQLLARVNSDPIAKAEWRLREKSIYDEASAMAGAREKGREEGIQKGQAYLIKNLLATGVSIDQVALATKMTPDEVDKLLLMDV